jgi:hypothetical protein
MKFWSGSISAHQILDTNKVFVFGSNPEGRHGLGAAKAAMSMGAVYGVGRGLQGNTYALPTKNISKQVPYTERCTGIVYEKSGKCSITLPQIKDNLRELCSVAGLNMDKKFYLVYQNSNKTLNGYSPNQIIELLKSLTFVPDNLIIHTSFKELWSN